MSMATAKKIETKTNFFMKLKTKDRKSVASDCLVIMQTVVEIAKAWLKSQNYDHVTLVE
jgi:hypothetical protein